MNLRLLICIVMGVFTAHIGVLMLWSHLRPKPKITPPLPRNFTTRAAIVEVDEKSGERTIEREITVSTKFADPKLLEAQPAR